ncbi:MAG: nitronate monooxygenase [Bacteroidetes bacterium]|nr:nitronate monooxygenase [Bacteroidota bacterium]MCH8524871.1 nitronate monooxygenase [Balneolales bacterium]
MFTDNRVTKLFNIQYPIIQAGMVWCSGWKLASAVSNAGGLGLIGAGSMYPDVLREHIQKCKAATDKPFGVNVPLLYPDIEKIMGIIEEEGVNIVFTSAGNPATWTSWLKDRGITVVHVVPNVKLARKCVERGVDAVVCEGFEAGGHNGKDEITTLVLVPQVVDAIGEHVPVIAAGGIGDGRAMAAAMALGADAVQVGSRFAVTRESSAHHNFKNRVVQADDTETVLTLKSVTPVRMLKNSFYEEVRQAEVDGADAQTLREILGRGRSKKGIFEGDLDQGELEIGQVSGLIDDIPAASDVIDAMISVYRKVVRGLTQ